MKKLSLVVVGMLFLLQSMSGFTGLNVADAASNNGVIEENILTSASMEVTKKDGSKVPLDQPIAIEDGMVVKLNYEWAFPNSHGYVGGDTFTFYLPEQFKIVGPDITGVLTDASIGTFIASAADNKVVMTFAPDVDADAVGGTMTFETKWNMDKIKETTTVVELAEINNKVVKVPLKFIPNVSKTIEKSGIPDKSKNAKNINWTIDANKKLDKIKDAVVTDEIPAGMELNPGSIHIFPLKVNLAGNVSVDPAAVELVLNTDYKVEKTGDNNDKDFKITFLNEIDSAYRIEYSTKLTDRLEKFDNTAVLSGEGITPVDATASVDVSYGKLLDKESAYDRSSQTITWTIKYNYGEMDIPQADAKLTDLFNDSQALVPGTLHVYNVTVDGNGNGTRGSEVQNYTDTPIPAKDGKAGFELQFNSAINTAYEIEYKTQPTGPVYANEKITNTVSTKGTDPVPKDRWIFQQFGIKSLDADYISKTIKWNIQINGNNKPMTDLKIADTFTGGKLELIPNTLSVVGLDPSKYDIIYPESSPGVHDYTKGFSIHLKEPVTTAFNITYETKFYSTDWDFGTLQASKNTAVITWEDADGKPHSVTAGSDFDPKGQAKLNGFKNGSYNPVTKKVTWKVGFNYNGKTVSNAELIDPLLAGQSFVDGSLKLFDMSIKKDGGFQIASTPIPDDGTIYTHSVDGDNKLHVKFNQTIDKPYYVTFETILDNTIIADKVENTAYLHEGIDKVTEGLYASVAIPHGTEYVTKGGKQNGGDIDWTITINQGQSHVTNAKIIDESSDGQIIKEDSFHLYQAIVDGNGGVTKDVSKELVQGTDYTVAVTKAAGGGQTFELSFKNPISTAYILEYKSTIAADDGDELSNAVTFAGTGVNVTDLSSEKTIVVGKSSGSGTGSGLRGSLSILKVDEKNTVVTLPGAVFQLDRKLSNGTIVPGSQQTTDADGKADFTNLRYGTYILKEIKAPAGYELNAADLEVTINSANALETITNKKLPDPPVNPTPPPVFPWPPVVDPGEPTEPEEEVDPETPTEPGEEETPPTKPGEPTDPSEPGKPGTPTDTTNPSKPGTNVKPGTSPEDLYEVDTDRNPLGGLDGGPKGKPSSSGLTTLPKTGEDSSLPYQFAGLGIIILGAFMLIRRRMNGKTQ
ncbi:LPXTG cell wall anchor domain-containing protein [Paenibacillus spongiae]|uniref:Ig-like domain-containing protein n=1 Tax=Paenibacillus spongiae TaxID=2909671 RepID=A0ABY5S6J9_9BACL|nr:LPXTG cell wall anchor domain-containing protein [Paenibacillus spongiae]UVI28353.1 Ig-like domain-containing protein [Paenibacillus spongiae]